MSTITGFKTTDIRFPTSKSLDGSDAMNTDPDYSAAYLEIVTDSTDGHSGHGFVFTIGRGNDIQVAAIKALEPMLVGKNVEQLLSDMGASWKLLVHDSQFRWLGPEKGVMHMAIGAVVNALWDLKAKRAGLPLWLLLARMSPKELADLVDYRYISDVVTHAEAIKMFEEMEATRERRIEKLIADGYPGYTTSPGWLGYDDEKLTRLCKEAKADGFGQIKLKVGADLEDDKRRFRIARQVMGPDYPIAIDANQRWDVQQAIDWVNELAEFNPAWIEEPTSPDDVVGHATIAKGVAPIRVATGEHGGSRVMFKQLMQLGGIHVVQIDATRVAGVNENIAIMLMAKKMGLPVCPHAGGVGLCEAVQHMSMFDYVSLSGTMEGRMIEFVDHLHEHFVDPVIMKQGSYQAPSKAGSSQEMFADSQKAFEFPNGKEWRN
jgi:L-fuconate dehydratase